MANIHWYPGHIAKVERELTPLLKLVDGVVVLLDARIPQATINPRLMKKLGEKPALILLNKADLADSGMNKAWLNHFKQQGADVLLYDTKTGKQKQNLINALIRLGETKMKSLEAKGLKRRPIRIGVLGMPNVGKSSLINSIVGKKKVQTGHKAGVTRTPQWVRIHPSVELLDTPGIIPPRIESPEYGLLLASVSSVGEAAIDEEEVAQFIIERIESLYPNQLRDHYRVLPDTPVSLEAIALSRQFLLPGGAPDLLRTAQIIFSDFRHGRLGKISLEHV